MLLSQCLDPLLRNSHWVIVFCGWTHQVVKDVVLGKVPVTTYQTVATCSGQDTPLPCKNIFNWNSTLCHGHECRIFHSANSDYYTSMIDSTEAQGDRSRFHQLWIDMTKYCFANENIVSTSYLPFSVSSPRAGSLQVLETNELLGVTSWTQKFLCSRAWGLFFD